MRAEEVRKAASAGLLESLIEDAEVLEKTIRDPAGSLLVVEIMLYADAGTLFAMWLHNLSDHAEQTKRRQMPRS